MVVPSFKKAEWKCASTIRSQYSASLGGFFLHSLSPDTQQKMDGWARSALAQLPAEPQKPQQPAAGCRAHGLVTAPRCGFCSVAAGRPHVCPQLLPGRWRSSLSGGPPWAFTLWGAFECLGPGLLHICVMLWGAGLRLPTPSSRCYTEKPFELKLTHRLYLPWLLP